MNTIGKVMGVKKFLLLIFLVISSPYFSSGKITLVYSLSEDGPTRFDQWEYNNAKFRDAIMRLKGLEWCVTNLSKYRKRATFCAILGQDGTIGFTWYPTTDLKKEYFVAIKDALDIMSERNDTLYQLPPYDSDILWSYQDSVFKVDSILRGEKMRTYFQYKNKYVHDCSDGANMLLFGEKEIAYDKIYTYKWGFPVGGFIYDNRVYEEYRKKCAEKGLREIDNERVTKNGDCEDLTLYWEYVRKSDREILRQPIDHNHMVSHFYYDAEANIGDATFIPGDTPRYE